MLQHNVMVVTAAGSTPFDGRAYVTLVCADGECAEAELLSDEGERMDFGPDTSYWFTISTYNLGEVKSVKLRAANTGSSSAWQLDRINMYSKTGDWTTHSYYHGKKVQAPATVTLEKLVRSRCGTLSTDWFWRAGGMGLLFADSPVPSSSFHPLFLFLR